MLPPWLSTWYQQKNEQQSQEPFNDQYATTEEEGDWVEVIKPSMKRQAEPQEPQSNKMQKDAEEQVSVENPATNQDLTAEKQVVCDVPTMKKEENKENLPELTKKETVSNNDEFDDSGKKLSRQERRAKARLAAREVKKQARNAAMSINRNRKGLVPSTCLPVTPLTAN